MLNLKKMSMAVFVVGSLLCFCSGLASAQLYRPGDNFDKAWRNNPCAEPVISWVLMTFEGHSQGGVDCDPSNYPGYQSFTTEGQMRNALTAYRAGMSKQNATIGSLFLAPNGHAMQTILQNNVPVADIDYGRAHLVSNSGGTFISDNGAALVATGRGTLVCHDGGGFRVADGGGGLAPRSLFANDGSKVIQFPGKWVKVAPVAQAQQPARPAAPAGRDDNILLCVSPTVNQIRRNDGGANHVSFTVAGGVARFSGNVLNQSYKDTLSRQATTCGGTPDVSSLRVGR